jgi:hypothetical protein
VIVLGNVTGDAHALLLLRTLTDTAEHETGPDYHVRLGPFQ